MIRAEQRKILYPANFFEKTCPKNNENSFETSLIPDKIFHELFLLKKADSILRDGETHLAALYSCRCCSKTLAPLSHNSNANEKIQHSLESFKILLPYMHQILKLSSFVEYLTTFFVQEFYTTIAKQNNSVKMDRKSTMKNSSFTSTISSLSLEEEENQCQVINTKLLEKMLDLFDLIIRIDALKDGKPSLLNDFSAFKRAFYLCKSAVVSSDLEIGEEMFADFHREEFNYINLVNGQISKLQKFLADPMNPKNKCITELQVRLEKWVDKKLSLFPQISAFLINKLRNERKNLFLDPVDKIKFIRCLPYVFFFVEGEIKEILFHQTHQVFSLYPVIPAGYDIFINTYLVLNKSLANTGINLDGYNIHSFVDENFKVNLNANPIAKSNTKYTLDTKKIRKIYLLSNSVNVLIKEYESMSDKIKRTCEYSLPLDQEGKNKVAVQAVKTCLETFKYIAKWKENLLFFFSLHNSCLLDDSMINVNHLVKFISCIKIMKAQLLQNKTYFVSCIEKFVTSQITSFFYTVLSEAMSNLSREGAKFNGFNLNNTLTLRKGQESKALSLVIKLREFGENLQNKTFGQIANSFSEIEVFCFNILEANKDLVTKKRSKFGTIGTLGRRRKVGLRSETLASFDKFLNRLKLFSKLIDFEHLVQNVSNLHQIYFSEFSKAIKNDESLLKQCLSCTVEEISPDVFYVLDVFNDVAFSSVQMRKGYFYYESKADFLNCMKSTGFKITRKIYEFEKFLSAKEVLKNVNSEYYKRTFEAENEEHDPLWTLASVSDWDDLNSRQLVLIKERIERLLCVDGVRFYGSDFVFSKFFSHLMQILIKRDLAEIVNKLKAMGIQGLSVFHNELEIVQLTYRALEDRLPITQFKLPEVQRFLCIQFVDFVINSSVLNFISLQFGYSDMVFSNCEVEITNVGSSNLAKKISDHISFQNHFDASVFSQTLLYNFNNYYDYKYLNLKQLFNVIINSNKHLFSTVLVKNYLNLSAILGGRFSIEYTDLSSNPGVDYIALAGRTQAERLIRENVQKFSLSICKCFNYLGNTFALLLMFKNAFDESQEKKYIEKNLGKNPHDFFKSQVSSLLLNLISSLDGMKVPQDVKLLSFDQLWSSLKYLSIFFEEMVQGKEVSEQFSFGDGLLLGGNLFQYALNQREYRVYDLNSHVLKAQEVELQENEGQDIGYNNPVVEYILKQRQVEAILFKVLRDVDVFSVNSPESNQLESTFLKEIENNQTSFKEVDGLSSPCDDEDSDFQV
eukprot:snap_masked-scaffold_33-processed-gene-0.23-mRNA-1 protein AED:1.00 eAED:1.00 QI:0/0/0/0/1/1/2/0/1250